MDYEKLEAGLKAAQSKDELQHAIVNLPFDQPVETAHLFLGIIVLLIANKQRGTIDRVALSKTELAQNTKNVSPKPFEEIRIPLDHTENIIAQAIATKSPQSTSDWKDLFAPELTPEEARLNQASGGIAYSAVYPLNAVPDGGAMIFSYYQYPQAIGEAQEAFMQRYSSLCSEALTKLGE